MFPILGIAAFVLLAVLLVRAAATPDTFRVQRATTIDAPPDKVFTLINDFQRWEAWSPFEKFDPAMKRSYSEPAAGMGAVYAWESRGKAGAGWMEITESSPIRVTIRLDVFEPFETRNVAQFTLRPEGEGDSTSVTWSVKGSSPFLAKLMSLFFNIDRAIGRNFETGLANLKAVAEA